MKIYESPKMELITFSFDDVITTSNGLKNNAKNTEGGWGAITVLTDLANQISGD